MPRITKYSRWQTPPKENFFSTYWNLFLSLDKFTRTIIVSGFFILIAVPAIVAQQTGFFSHAGGSVYTNCVVAPPGFTQDQLQMLSQSRQINWCKTLARNIDPSTQDTSSQGTGDQSNTSPADNNILIVLYNKVQQILLTIQKLFLGR